MTPRINPLGWVVLAGIVGTTAWLISHPKFASGAPVSKWVPARPVRQGITQVLWKAETDMRIDQIASTPPDWYDAERNEFVWADGFRRVAVRVWAYR